MFPLWFLFISLLPLFHPPSILHPILMHQTSYTIWEWKFWSPKVAFGPLPTLPPAPTKAPNIDKVLHQWVAYSRRMTCFPSHGFYLVNMFSACLSSLLCPILTPRVLKRQNHLLFKKSQGIDLCICYKKFILSYALFSMHSLKNIYVLWRHFFLFSFLKKRTLENIIFLSCRMQIPPRS